MYELKFNTNHGVEAKTEKLSKKSPLSGGNDVEICSCTKPLQALEEAFLSPKCPLSLNNFDFKFRQNSQPQIFGSSKTQRYPLSQCKNTHRVSSQMTGFDF